jgi:hypothetical protein
MAIAPADHDHSRRGILTFPAAMAYGRSPGSPSAKITCPTDNPSTGVVEQLVAATLVGLM